MSQVNEFYEANEKKCENVYKKEVKNFMLFHFGIQDALISGVGVL